MISSDLLSQVSNLAESASQKADEYSGVLGSARELILEHFGENGLIAAYIAIAVLALFLISKLVKLSVSALKYLVIPALALAALASFVTPFSFFVALPVTVTACSLVLLFKG